MVHKLSTIESSINKVDLNKPFCSFCGAPQSLKIDGATPIYRYCSCEGSKSYRTKTRAIRELTEELSDIDLEIESRRLYAEKYLDASNIGNRFRVASFETFSRNYNPVAYDRALNFAKDFSSNSGEGLIFTGSVGTGKTHLAASIANYVAHNYASSVEFVCYVALLSEVKNAMFSSGGNLAEIENRMFNSDLLVLDDLGKEKASAFTNEFLFRVINKRYKDNLPIIITSNYQLPDLFEKLDEAIVSRLIGTCKAVDTNGKDYRLREVAI